jgi:hypothetical protein
MVDMTDSVVSWDENETVIIRLKSNSRSRGILLNHIDKESCLARRGSDNLLSC